LGANDTTETVFAMDSNKVPRTIRLLQRAEGYLELELPDRAIGELNSIVDAGPFEPAVALLRGEALKSQARYDEALVPLKQAATTIPAPLNKRAWRSMSECYRLTGHPELAEIADLVVNSDLVVEPEEGEAEPHVTVHFAVVPMAMVGQALKQLLLGIRQIKEATGETTEGQSATE
jgi:hypothetical protein